MVLFSYVFLDFLESNISGPEQEQLPAEFTAAAAPESTPERVTVTLDLDADVLEWLKAQPLGWQHELNNLARFLHGNACRFRRRTSLTPSPTTRKLLSKGSGAARRDVLDCLAVPLGGEARRGF
jgi:hypothetical protein